MHMSVTDSLNLSSNGRKLIGTGMKIFNPD